MFGSLKEKLSKWVKKNKEPEEDIVETPKEKERPEVKSKSERKTESGRKKGKEKEGGEEIGESEDLDNEKIEELKEKKSFFSKFTKKLEQDDFDEMFEELEMILLQNNVAYSAVDSIRNSLEKNLIGKSMKDVNLSQELKNAIEDLLIDPPKFLDSIKESLKEKTPFIILFAGINGAGKTTTIAKIANYLQKNNLSVCLAAADTFRAAAIQQLEEHANKLGAPIIKKDYGVDPASVGFDAISYAKKNKIDVVLIDTAGRMQNRDSLMKEIEKIERVNRPDMKIFLGESITGNDATEQAKAFHEAINLTGIILSKADVDEKGGTAISVSHVTGKPILFLGTGQEYKDLEVFDKNKLIEKLGL